MCRWERPGASPGVAPGSRPRSAAASRRGHDPAGRPPWPAMHLSRATQRPVRHQPPRDFPDGLGAGNSEQYIVEVRVSSGTYTFVATADSVEQVAESRENDNKRTEIEVVP